MDKNEARRIMNLDEKTTKRQVESRFANLSRRVKNGEDLDFKSIKSAYDILMGYEKYNDKAGKVAIAFRKLMFNYKGWAILVLISVVIISIIFIPMIFRRVPDLTVSFAGRYGIIDQDVMDDILQENMPETSDILVEIMYLDEDGESGEFDSGGRTRLSGLLISEEADILIVDDETFNYVREDNVLMPLDELLEGLEVEVSEDRFIYGVDFDTGEKMVFGISVTDNYLVYRTVYGEERRILTVARKTTHLDDIKKAIEIILTYRSD